jgi:hypothetical protein
VKRLRLASKTLGAHQLAPVRKKFKTLPAHRLAGARKHGALSSSRRAPHYLRVADLAVALLDSLFEHPEVIWR